MAHADALQTLDTRPLRSSCVHVLELSQSVDHLNCESLETLDDTMHMCIAGLIKSEVSSGGSQELAVDKWCRRLRQRRSHDLQDSCMQRGLPLAAQDVLTSLQKLSRYRTQQLEPNFNQQTRLLKAET